MLQSDSHLARTRTSVPPADDRRRFALSSDIEEEQPQALPQLELPALAA